VIPMDKKRERDFLKVLGSKYTKDILEYIDEHGKGQYTEFREFANAHILNVRLRQLLKFKLIQHCMVRNKLKKEWYELTERGRMALQFLEEQVNLIEDSGEVVL